MKYFNNHPAAILEKLLKQKKGTLIDVRTPEELATSKVPNSINIPLNELPDRLVEIEAMAVPLIFFCDTGIRSAQAYGFTKSKKIDCIHAGSLSDVVYLLSMK